MTKGTYSMGKKNKISHIHCRRCGRHSYHIRDGICSSCGFGKSRRIKSNASIWKSAIGKGNRKKWFFPDLFKIIFCVLLLD